MSNFVKPKILEACFAYLRKTDIVFLNSTDDLLNYKTINSLYLIVLMVFYIFKSYGVKTFENNSTTRFLKALTWRM